MAPMSTSPPPPESSFKGALGAAFGELRDTFVHLLRAPRALWGVNISYFLEGLAYFGILTILGKFLSEDVGLADAHATWVYGLFTGGITLAMLVLGGVADRIGVRRALVISLLMMVVGRAVIAFGSAFFATGQGASGAMFATTLAGLLVVVVGYGMYQPASYAGVKAYTNKKTAAIGYAMIYALMNLGAFISGIISPPIRRGTGMAGVYWTYVFVTALAAGAVLWVLSARVAAAARRQVLAEDAAAEEGRDAPPPAGDGAGSGKLADENEGVAEEGHHAQEATTSAGRSFLEPQTLALVLLVLVTGAGFIRQLIRAPEPLGAAQFLAARELLKGAARAPAAAASQLRSGPLRTLVAPPKPAAHPVDTSAFGLARLQLASLAGFVAQLERWPAAAAPAATAAAKSAPALAEARLLQVEAVRMMAAAYGLVAPVDLPVVEQLLKRLRSPQQPELVLGAAQRQQVIALSSGEPGALLGGLAQRLKQSGARLDGAQALDAEQRQALLVLMEHTATFYRQAARLSPLAKVGRELLLERLLADAQLFYALGERLRAAGAEPRSATGRALLLLKLEAEGNWYRDNAPLMARAAQPTAALAASIWFSSYGVWLLPGLLFLALLIRRLLVLRPEHPFHNTPFTFFIFILIPVQTLFAHNWLTLPYYIDRAFAGTSVGENFEFFSNLNPVLIFVLTPMVAALTSRANVYRMMVWGTLVMALPTFLLALPPNPALLMAYIGLMAVGEAMWQPRFLQLVAEIAPEGKTGAYMGIAQLPWFLTKLVTASYAGLFIGAYCPKVGPQNTETMWLLHGAIAMVTPVALWMARGWIAERIAPQPRQAG